MRELNIQLEGCRYRRRHDIEVSKRIIKTIMIYFEVSSSFISKKGVSKRKKLNVYNCI